jgi:FdhD protein
MEDAISIAKLPIARFSDKGRVDIDDVVTVEEPLEIFVDDEPFYLTMRMPGEEIPLALGLCFTDGIINSMEDVVGANYCSDLSRNKINIYLNPKSKKENPPKERKNRFPTYSSCGICGRDMVESAFTPVGNIGNKVKVDISQILAMQTVLHEKQHVFPLTGGTHAAAIFSADGELLSLSEDVGRHNALDKAIGKLLFAKSIGKAAIGVLSSRLSFEMVQKAARLGVEILCGASSPTSLAIDLARTSNLTLIGFLREHRGNVYTSPERIRTATP